MRYFNGIVLIQVACSSFPRTLSLFYAFMWTVSVKAAQSELNESDARPAAWMKELRPYDTLILVLGAIEQEIWAKLWSFWRHMDITMAATRVANFWGPFCYDLYRTLVQSVMLSFKN